MFRKVSFNGPKNGDPKLERVAVIFLLAGPGFPGLYDTGVKVAS